MIYEITVETTNNYHTFKESHDTLEDAVASAKSFASDWWRGADYSVFCDETNQYQTGEAN